LVGRLPAISGRGVRRDAYVTLRRHKNFKRQHWRVQQGGDRKTLGLRCLVTGGPDDDICPDPALAQEGRGEQMLV
jgi:hypothetical protein